MRIHIQTLLARLLLPGLPAAAVFMSASSVFAAENLQAVNLKARHAVNPVGIDITRDGAPEGYTWCAAENASYTLNGTLRTWPKWLGEDKSNPSGRFTFTSWRLWDKDSPLVSSGLLGPVTLQQAVELPEAR